MTQIDDNVENGSGRNPDKLPLSGFSRLIVQTAQNVLGRSAVVVLDKVGGNAQTGEGVAVPALEEKPPGVTEYFGFE